METSDAVTEWLKFNREQYEPHLRNAIALRLKELIAYTERRYAQLEAEYTELTKLAKPFAQRKPVGDKMLLTSHTLASFKHDLAHFRPLPLQSWLLPEDLILMETIGFLATVSYPLNFSRTYTV